MPVTVTQASPVLYDAQGNAFVVNEAPSQQAPASDTLPAVITGIFGVIATAIGSMKGK